MKIKRISLLLIITFLGVLCLPAVSPIETHIKASFTYSNSCFIGFSKNNVDTCVPIQNSAKYAANESITCKYVTEKDAYVSEVFYAYCQAFSSNRFSFTVSAPMVMEPSAEEDKGVLNSIPFDVLKPKGGVNTSEAWQNDGSTYTYTVTDVSVPENTRVLLSLPIQISVPAANVLFGKTYDMDITLGVVSV